MMFRSPVALIMAALWLPFSAVAQNASPVISDPTKPPAELLRGGDAEEGSVVAEPPRVHSVKISKSSKYAVIAGTVVKEGDTFNQMKVVRIHHRGVDLQGESGPVALLVNPSVTKTERKPPEQKRANNDSKRSNP